MHLQLYIRGINTQVELWKIMAQAQFFKWTRTDVKTGKDWDCVYQMALRPSIFGTWELVFPEECLPTLLSMLGITFEGYGMAGTKHVGIKMAVLRKMCGVKKIPKKALEEASKIQDSMFLTNSLRAFYHLKINGVSLHPIGIKKDKYGEILDKETGKTNYQEYL